MQKHLFTFGDWDIVDTFVFSFYEAVLIKDIGEFKTGDKFAYITLDYDTGYIEFYKQTDKPTEDDDNINLVGKYSLNLTIGDKINE